MKLIAFLIFLGALTVSASSYSQKTRLDLKLEEASLEEILLSIESNSRFIFIYDADILDSESKHTLSVKSAQINTILDQLFDKTDIEYLIDDRQVFLYQKDDLDAIAPLKRALLSEQATKKITGVVLDTNGHPLPGVTVVVKGTTNGTITDIDGAFTLSGVGKEAVLAVSFIGMKAQELAVGATSDFKIVMEEETIGVDEVIVVGYATQRKATITGSIATITTRDLKQSPTANLTNALAGRMPGLMVNQFSGGEPGVDRSDVYVRGFGTYGEKSPIVIVDGVERSMSYLAPEEIETFTILKDASATAPFGVRGANGVIIITTKRGKSQEKATVNFKASVGTNQPVKFPKYLGSADYAMLYNEAKINDNPGIDPNTLTLFSQDAIDKFRRAKGDNSDSLGYNWDYFDYAFKPGVQEDYSLSIRGGSDRARYYVMANYFEQQGNYSHSDLAQYSTQAVFKRYNFRSNIDIDITKDFYVRLDLGARITDRNAPGTTASRIVEICNTQPPHLPIVMEDNGNVKNSTYFANFPNGLLFGDQIYRFNLLGELSRTGFLNEKNTYLDGSFSMGHKLDFITKGLKVEGVFSYDASEGRWINRKVNTYSEGYREYPGYATFMPEVGRDFYMSPGVYTGVYKTGNKYSLDQTIGNDISRNSTIGRTYYQVKFEYMRKFGNHDVSGLLLANRSIRNVDNQVAFCYQGVTGRATYNYSDRYLFELNVGFNGSENFAPGNRYGFFPAGSVGWLISNETFMAGTKSWLDNLKIRGSFGMVGSDQIPNSKRFIYLQYFNGGSDYSFGTDNFGAGAGGGLKEGDLANPNLSWEKARKTDIGFDALLFNKRLSVVADYFFEHRYDIITDLGGGNKMGFPDVVGKDAPYINSGIVDNYGIDFEIGWNGKIGRDFTYYLKPNLSFARNKIKFMNEIPRDYTWRTETGKRIGEHFVYVFDHFVKNQTEADELNNMNSGAGYQTWGRLIPGDVVYKDLNGDGKINDLGDRTTMGNPRSPEIMFGIPVGAQYKGFDFSMMFQGATSSSVQLNGAAVWDFPLFSQDKFGKVKPMHLDRWTPETAETAKYPALHFGDHSNNKNANSSLFLYNASYLRLKTVEIGYSLPKSAIRFAGLQQVRFYVQGLNLFTWDSLDDVDIDPETREGSGDWYPVQKVINFGVDVTF